MSILVGVWSAVHGYVETASVIVLLNHADQTSDDIVGHSLYRTQFKVGRPPTLSYSLVFVICVCKCICMPT